MPLLAVQLVADYLMFERLQVNLYELDAWLAEEVRTVLRIVRKMQHEEAARTSRSRETA